MRGLRRLKSSAPEIGDDGNHRRLKNYRRLKPTCAENYDVFLLAPEEVMPIHCAATLESSEATRVAFRGKNCKGGPWLPQEIEIALVEKEDGELVESRCSLELRPPRSSGLNEGWS